MLLTGDQAAGHFGAAFRVYDVAWVVLASLEAAVYPELARTPGRRSRGSGRVTTQAFEALLLVALPIALGLAVGASWLTPRIYGPGYGPTGPVLAVLGAAVACAMLAHLLGVVLLALDRPRRLRAVAAAGVRDGAARDPGPRGARRGARRGGGRPGRRGRRPRWRSLGGVRRLAGWPFGRGAA